VSDLHLKSGSNVRIRVNGELLKLGNIINQQLEGRFKTSKFGQKDYF